MSKKTSTILQGELNSLPKEKETRTEHLRNEIQKGLDSGLSEGFDINQFLADRDVEFKL